MNPLATKLNDPVGVAPLSAPGVLADLGGLIPIVAAPMAGGPSTPALVIAAAQAGGIGFLAGGYKTADALADQIMQVSANADRFGVNLFAPNPVPVDPGAYARYAESLRALGAIYDVDPTLGPLKEDDDSWDTKVALLLENPVPVVSFTFGIPNSETIDQFKRVGTTTVQTVTNVAEARRAAAAGIDVLVVQSYLAGGHSGTTTPDLPIAEIPLPQLVQTIQSEVALPIWAAGGVVSTADVRAVLAVGAEAAVVGTLLLRTPESGASRPYRDALAELGRTDTVITRAFSGRPAQPLRRRVSRPRTTGLPGNSSLDQPDPESRCSCRSQQCRAVSSSPDRGSSASSWRSRRRGCRW